jgi:transposase
MSKYTEGIKRKVVKQHIRDGGTIASLSAEYGASKATVSNWVRDYRKECQNNDEAKNEYELMQEVRKLRQQLEESEKENRFLKKRRHSLQRESIRGLSIYHRSSGRIWHTVDASADGALSQRLLQSFKAKENCLLCP